MKIICIGRNYLAHAQELQNDVPDKPMLFLKPDTALLQGNKPFYYPDFTQNLHYECEIVLRIGKQGKYIAEKFANRYISHYGLGIDLTARDLQDSLKKAGHPWEIAKAFDNAAIVGELLPFDGSIPLNNLTFSLFKNKECVQKGHTSQMIFNIPYILHYASQYFSLRPGDLLFTGTPAGVGPLVKGDVLLGYLGEQLNLQCEIK